MGRISGVERGWDAASTGDAANRLRRKSSVWVEKEPLAVSEVGVARMPPNDFGAQGVGAAWQD